MTSTKSTNCPIPAHSTSLRGTVEEEYSSRSITDSDYRSHWKMFASPLAISSSILNYRSILPLECSRYTVDYRTLIDWFRVFDCCMRWDGWWGRYRNPHFPFGTQTSSIRSLHLVSRWDCHLLLFSSVMSLRSRIEWWDYRILPYANQYCWGNYESLVGLSLQRRQEDSIQWE